MPSPTSAAKRHTPSPQRGGIDITPRIPVREKHMNSKKKAILDRINHLEDAIAKGREYLESGKHAHWHGFRPLFFDKVSGGKKSPPHKDWIRNVFLPRSEKELRTAQDELDKLT
ncbi:MAG: hypothetical protein WC655_06825 [Candidatus Hydrogenedentales bacterium]